MAKQKPIKQTHVTPRLAQMVGGRRSRRASANHHDLALGGEVRRGAARVCLLVGTEAMAQPEGLRGPRRRRREAGRSRSGTLPVTAGVPGGEDVRARGASGCRGREDPDGTTEHPRRDIAEAHAGHGTCQ